MLLIQNIETIIDRVVLREWWVENYELIGDNQYQFLVSNIKTLKKFTIQVERLPIGDKKLIYEVWAWKEDGNIVRRKICIVLTGIICLVLIALVVVLLKSSIIN